MKRRAACGNWDKAEGLSRLPAKLVHLLVSVQPKKWEDNMSRARAPTVLKQVVVMRELLERPAVAVDAINEAIGRRERYLWAESSHVKRKIEDVGGWQVVGAKRVRVG